MFDIRIQNAFSFRSRCEYESGFRRTGEGGLDLGELWFTMDIDYFP